MHIRQPKSPSLEFEVQLLMMYAHQVKQRSLKIVDMYRVLDDIVTKVIGHPIREPLFDTSTSHPERVATRVVVAAKAFMSQSALGVSCAAKFPTPDDKCVFQ